MHVSPSNRRESGIGTRPHFLQLLCPGFFQGDCQWGVSDPWFITLDYFPLLVAERFPTLMRRRFSVFANDCLQRFLAHRSGTLLVKELDPSAFLTVSARDIHPATSGHSWKEHTRDCSLKNLDCEYGILINTLEREGVEYVETTPSRMARIRCWHPTLTPSTLPQVLQYGSSDLTETGFGRCGRLRDGLALPFPHPFIPGI